MCYLRKKREKRSLGRFYQLNQINLDHGQGTVALKAGEIFQRDPKSAAFHVCPHLSSRVLRGVVLPSCSWPARLCSSFFPLQFVLRHQPSFFAQHWQIAQFCVAISMSPPSPLYLLLCCQTDFPIQNRCTAVAADTYFPLSPEGQSAGVEEPPASQGRTSALEMPRSSQERKQCRAAWVWRGTRDSSRLRWWLQWNKILHACQVGEFKHWNLEALWYVRWSSGNVTHFSV